MTLSTSTIQSNYNLTALHSAKQENINTGQKSQNQREQLTQVLFGSKRSESKGLTFGWSKGIPAVEAKILDILTDPGNRNALVVSHISPDGDAYGSNIGISGILKSMGVWVFPVVNDSPANRFSRMPSPLADKSATEFIMRPRAVNKILTDRNIRQLDVAVITDAAEPHRISDESLELVSKAKKVIIIDHHEDEKGEPTNKTKWIRSLEKLGVPEENVIYWREPRVSASEMVAEIDKEVVDQAKKSLSRPYNPQKNKVDLKYRLATAGGIMTDAGGKSPIDFDKPRFSAISSKKLVDDDGELASATKVMFKWLANNSGVDKSQINMADIIYQDVPEALSRTINSIIDQETSIPGIEIKKAGNGSKVHYVYIKEWSAMNELALQAKAEGSNLNASDIYSILKGYAQKRISDIQPGEALIIATKSYGNKGFGMSVRSKDGSAVKICNTLERQRIGRGGGHDDASGFKSAPGKDFIRDALPIIEQVLQENSSSRSNSQTAKNSNQLAFLGAKLNLVI